MFMEPRCCIRRPGFKCPNSGLVMVGRIFKQIQESTKMYIYVLGFLFMRASERHGMCLVSLRVCTVECVWGSVIPCLQGT